ncbi:MAG: hypothetical protein CMJ94_04605 [Planctomycetes bacterium]|nr:hypothetical protein [Planctomycetota bacterium]
MKKLVPLVLLLPFLASCAAVPIAAAAAVGVWSYDRYNEEGGSLPVEAPQAKVWSAMKQVANERATGPIEITEASERVVGEISECTVYMSVLPYLTTESVVEIKVRAVQGQRERGDIAKEIAEDIAGRL